MSIRDDDIDYLHNTLEKAIQLLNAFNGNEDKESTKSMD
ncbi:conserved hypothetical protein [Lactococcus piscium]|nr:conserved hypothetical protein [Lactococcus piscium]